MDKMDNIITNILEIEQNAKNHGEIVDFYKKEMARIRGEELNENDEPEDTL